MSELYIEPPRFNCNVKNGQFLKGSTPFNKGRKWSEWMTKRVQKRAKKGWANLDKYRPKTRPDNAGRCRKAVIAVADDGTWQWFPSISHVGEMLGVCRENVRRCCKTNRKGVTPTKSWKRVNTDHKYKGLRFYYESDNIWLEKIKK
jgi:hypothetical protein